MEKNKYPLIENIVKSEYKGYTIHDIVYLQNNNQFLGYIKRRAEKYLLDPKVKKAIRKKYRSIIQQYQAGKIKLAQAIEEISRELRSRMRYRIEPPGIEVLIHNWDRVLHGRYDADCDDMAIITAVIFKTFFPRVKITMFFVALGNRKKLHHAYITADFSNGKKFIIDLTRNNNKKRIVNKYMATTI